MKNLSITIGTAVLALGLGFWLGTSVRPRHHFVKLYSANAVGVGWRASLLFDQSTGRVCDSEGALHAAERTWQDAQDAEQAAADEKLVAAGSHPQTLPLSAIRSIDPPNPIDAIFPTPIAAAEQRIAARKEAAKNPARMIPFPPACPEVTQ